MSFSDRSRHIWTSDRALCSYFLRIVSNWPTWALSGRRFQEGQSFGTRFTPYSDQRNLVSRFFRMLIDLVIILCSASLVAPMWYSAPEVAYAPSSSVSAFTPKADVWSWGAILYRVAYFIPPEYSEPCYQPPAGTNPSRDPHLIDVLKHTLVRNPAQRADAKWLAAHPFSTAKAPSWLILLLLTEFHCLSTLTVLMSFYLFFLLRRKMLIR